MIASSCLRSAVEHTSALRTDKRRASSPAENIDCSWTGHLTLSTDSFSLQLTCHKLPKVHILIFFQGEKHLILFSDFVLLSYVICTQSVFVFATDFF